MTLRSAAVTAMHALGHFSWRIMPSKAGQALPRLLYPAGFRSPCQPMQSKILQSLICGWVKTPLETETSAVRQADLLKQGTLGSISIGL
eukprot:s2083_g15.t1